jgi:hypothetical protein
LGHPAIHEVGPFGGVRNPGSREQGEDDRRQEFHLEGSKLKAEGFHKERFAN